MTFIVWEYLQISFNFGTTRGTYDSRIDNLIMQYPRRPQIVLKTVGQRDS